jgi:hypothetical protein
MEQAKLETAAAAGMTGLRFVAKLKKGKREKRKAAFMARQMSTHRAGGNGRQDSVFKNVKTTMQIDIARAQLADARTVQDFHQVRA